jgi:hypothetical protein
MSQYPIAAMPPTTLDLARHVAFLLYDAKQGVQAGRGVDRRTNDC